MVVGSVAVAVVLATKPVGQTQGGATPLTLLSKDGRRQLPINIVNDQEFVALDDLAGIFQFAIREESGALTVAYKGKTIVLGLVTTKLGTMESKEDLKRRIDEAARYCPLEQLALSPQCGFASGAPGNKISLDDELRKLRLVVETAREVWGE